MRRPDWDNYFMEFAKVAAMRGTCDRKQVGAVLTRDQQIIATGYNGSISGQPHCDEVGHDMENGHCVRTIHAEKNALLQAAKSGRSLEGSTCYTTATPCWECLRVLVQAGVKRFVYQEPYREDETAKARREALPVEFVCLGDIKYLTAYSVTREYGGPEEGGWWYDDYQVLESIRLTRCDQATIDNERKELEEKYSSYDDGRPLSSVLSSGKLMVFCETIQYENESHGRPHYE